MPKEISEQTLAILYYEPDRDIRELVTDLLKPTQLVYPAENLRDALVMLEARFLRFDCLVIPGQINGRSSLDFVRKIRDIDPQLPVVIFTNHAEVFKQINDQPEFEADKIFGADKMKLFESLDPILARIHSRANLQD